jgi:hypothetical protein
MIFNEPENCDYSCHNDLVELIKGSFDNYKIRYVRHWSYKTGTVSSYIRAVQFDEETNITLISLSYNNLVGKIFKYVSAE